MKTKLFRIPINLGKTKLFKDKKIPMFTFETTDGEIYTNQNLLGKRYIISTFPDVNSKVCKVQTRTMIQEFSNYENTLLFNVAINSKDSFDTWCAVQGLDALMVSDTKAKLGKTLGLKLPLINVLARSVVLVDEDGYVRHIEVMNDIVDEPDYKLLRDRLLSL